MYEYLGSDGPAVVGRLEGIESNGVPLPAVLGASDPLPNLK